MPVTLGESGLHCLERLRSRADAIRRAIRQEPHRLAGQMRLIAVAGIERHVSQRRASVKCRARCRRRMRSARFGARPMARNVRSSSHLRARLPIPAPDRRPHTSIAIDAAPAAAFLRGIASGVAISRRMRRRRDVLSGDVLPDPRTDSSDSQRSLRSDAEPRINCGSAPGRSRADRQVATRDVDIADGSSRAPTMRQTAVDPAREKMTWALRSGTTRHLRRGNRW